MSTGIPRPSKLSYYEEIWRGYKYFAESAFIMRSGYRMMGMTESDLGVDEHGIAKTFWRRGESVLEHSAKVAYLCSVFLKCFPSCFVSQETGLVEMSFTDWSLMTTALLHDAGEIAIGDIPDDGNALRATKDARERKFFEREVASVYPEMSMWLLMENYDSFQKKNTLAGWMLYALDKLEAVLYLLWLEQYEMYGLITAKPLPTMQDKDFMQMTGTPCATDCWAAHLKVHLKKAPREVRSRVYGVLRAAAIDVRGEMFEWWHEVPIDDN